MMKVNFLKINKRGPNKVQGLGKNQKLIGGGRLFCTQVSRESSEAPGQKKEMRLFRALNINLVNYCWLSLWGSQTSNHLVLWAPLDLEALVKFATLLAALLVPGSTEKFPINSNNNL